MTDSVVIDTQLDVTVYETAEREALRQRSLESLEWTTALLVKLRDPELVRRAAEAQREYQQRSAEERAAEAERVTRQSPPPAACKAAPGLAPQLVAYVSRKFLFRQIEFIAKEVGQALTNVNNRLVLRFREDERRLDDIEARLAKLEGRDHG